jgi:hypothetical protein
MEVQSCENHKWWDFPARALCKSWEGEGLNR